MMRSLRNMFQRLWNPDSPRPLWEEIVLCLLTPLSWVYCAIQMLRRGLYRRGTLCTRRLDSPVISVGGLRVGGSGKTPFVRWMAHNLAERGYRVAILTRGYGRDRPASTLLMTAENRDRWSPELCGDEPYMLAKSLGDIPIVVDSDRYRGGVAASGAIAVDLFLMDDGFQHLRLARDCNILLHPEEEDPSRMVCLPAGPLREPFSAVQDADIVVRVSGDVGNGESPRNLPDSLCDAVGGGNVFRVCMAPGDLRVMGTNRSVAPASLEGEKIFAFCGIARPQVFWRSLERKGLRVHEKRAYPDHHRYSVSDHREILETMSRFTWAVTTEKDAGKLSCFSWPPGRLLVLDVCPVLSDEHAFWKRLEGCLTSGSRHWKRRPAVSPVG